MLSDDQPAPQQRRRRGLGDIGDALAFLTRFWPNGLSTSGTDLAAKMWAFPLAGLAIGLIAAVVYALAHLLLPAYLAAPLAIGAAILATGGLHEDGIADTADGFGGGRDRDSKLEIMRDHRIGTYGALALVLSLGLRIGALAAIGGSLRAAGALIAAHVAARAAIPVAMRLLDPARGDGLGAGAGRPSTADAGLAATLAIVIAALVLPPGMALCSVLGAAIGAALMIRLAKRQIGGHTGDVLGAIEQAAEALALLGAVAAL
jgi:adenosylcobinamide-GDP ribazoletransferase